MINVMPNLMMAQVLYSALNMPTVKDVWIPPSMNTLMSKDGQDDSGFISGRVLEKGLPVSRRVMCYHRRTGILIANTRSDADGYFRFDKLMAGIKVFITSIDDDGDSVQHKAVTGDFITVQKIPLVGAL